MLELKDKSLVKVMKQSQGWQKTSQREIVKHANVKTLEDNTIDNPGRHRLGEEFKVVNVV